ncbi:unnamed protein product [Dovyalis caffra]|uniref:Ferredoxin n=1 Tax=Dovyalis caffra TaxID=77055 RepID=A0AAV1R853_9ROSI|nr:unnamed protein product [Dovyalis caffra]
MLLSFAEGGVLVVRLKRGHPLLCFLKARLCFRNWSRAGIPLTNMVSASETVHNIVEEIASSALKRERQPSCRNDGDGKKGLDQGWCTDCWVFGIGILFCLSVYHCQTDSKAMRASDARLRGGDLLVFGRGDEEMDFLQQQRIQFFFKLDAFLVTVFSELKDPADEVALATLVSPTLVVIGKVVALSTPKATFSTSSTNINTTTTTPFSSATHPLLSNIVFSASFEEFSQPHQRVKMTTVNVPSQSLLKAAPQNRFTSTIVKCPSSLGSVKSVSKSFGLKCSPNYKASMAVYKVKLITPEGEEHEFEAPDDTYILDAAENAGVELPYSCRAGACSTCAGKVESGSVDQSDGSFLDENQMKEGYLLTCISYPTADCVIHTHKEGDLY